MKHLRVVGFVVVALVAAAGDVRAEPQQDKPWRISLSAGGGYNDNPAAIGHTITFGTPGSAVPFVTDKQSAFGRFTFDGSFDLLADDLQILTIGYGLHGDLYEGSAKDTNFQKHNWWIGYTRKVLESTSLTLQLADEYVNIGGDSFSNAILVETTLYHRFAEWVAVEAKHRAGFVDMMFPVVGAGFDRDGTFHDLSATVLVDVPNTQLKLRAGYRHRWYFTESGNGGRYDHESDVITLGASHPLPLDVTLDVSWSHQWDDYAGIVVGPGTIRSDTVDFFSVSLTRPLCPYSKLYFRFDYIDADSNGTLFDYRQRVYAAGVIFEF